MKHYIEITLLPGADVTFNFLWEKVYQQLHLGFVAMKDEQERVPIGVSFPTYRAKHLGHNLRLFAENEVLLEQFNARGRLADLADYVHVTGIRFVPDKIEKYACFYRIQPKSNYARLERRKAKRVGKQKQDISSEPLRLWPNHFYKEDFGSYQEQRTTAPFINMKSSKGYNFRLFIGYVEQSESNCERFSSYGLSRQSTIPVF